MKKSLVNKVLLGLMVSGNVIWGGAAVHAEDTEQQFFLDEIVVTATRTPVKEFDANANISVVTKEEIEKNHYADVSEAIRNVQGVNILNYGANGEAYSSNGLYINGSANVVFLVDGMRANTNGSTFSKAPIGEFVNMDAIERIEVLKGSASTLYGSDAQGGVINIITKKVRDGEIKTKIVGQTGSYNSEQYNFAHVGGKDGFYWEIDAQKRLMGDYTDGNSNSVINGLNSTALNFKLGKKLGEKADITLGYQKYNGKYERPDNGSLSKQRDYGEKDNDKLSLVYDQKITENLSNRLSIFKNDSIVKDNYTSPNVWYMDLTTEGFSDQLTYTDKNHTIIGGIDYYKDKVNKYISQVESYDEAKEISNKALFIQDEWKFSKGWSLVPGLRFDRHSKYGSHTTPSIVLGYNQNEKTNYYVSYKEFFVAPNQYMIFSKMVGNGDLKAEEGNTLEFGINHRFDDTFLGTFHIYKQKAENVISYKSVPTSVAPYGVQYYNIAEQKSYGWDIGLKKQWNKNFSTDVTYTYLHIDAQKGENSNLNGRLPQGTWSIGANYDENKFSALVKTRGVINREGGINIVDIDHSAYVTYWVWDLAVNYKPTKNIKVFGKVNNLFDKYYSEYGTAGKPSPSGWYAMPGRNFQVGVEYSF